jgi:hypothetical protein
MICSASRGIALIPSPIITGKTSLYIVLTRGEFPVVGVQWLLDFVENDAY